MLKVMFAGAPAQSVVGPVAPYPPPAIVAIITQVRAMCIWEYCGITLLCFLINVAMRLDATIYSVIINTYLKYQS
jgi:hypothetical protein